MIELLSSGAVMTEEAYETEERQSLWSSRNTYACPLHVSKKGPALQELHSLKVTLSEPVHSWLVESAQRT